MAAKKVGTLIKQARTEAGLTQEELARKAKHGLSASDISRAERGELALSQEQLKAIAKVTGVTQKSLLDAAKGGKKTTSGSSTASKSSIKVTATEKRLVELYREADSATKKAALDLLRGNDITAGGVISSLLDGVGDLFKGEK